MRRPKIAVVDIAWLRLTLEIDPTADPVAGTIHEQRGHPLGAAARSRAAPSSINALDEAVRNAGAGSHDEG